MRIDGAELLLALALVYVLVEFYGQPYQRAGTASRLMAPWAHATIHGMALAGVLLLATHELGVFWLAAGLIFPGYLLLACWRSRDPVESLSRFFVDQGLHLLLLLLVAVFHVEVALPAGWQEAVLIPQVMGIVLAYLLVLQPTSQLIQFFLRPWMAATTSDGVSLQKAGEVIGYLERILILTFVLMSQYLAIGFVLALKAAYRFKDTEQHAKAEYMLMGTFLSLVLTLAVGIVVRYLLIGG